MDQRWQILGDISLKIYKCVKLSDGSKNVKYNDGLAYLGVECLSLNRPWSFAFGALVTKGVEAESEFSKPSLKGADQKNWA